MAAYAQAIRPLEQPDRERALAAAGAQLLTASASLVTILAEGDSWFDYPLGTDVIRSLGSMLNLPIANMAHHGDEVRQMLALKQRREIEKRLSGGAPNGRPWDALLFSGGGNDFVGDELCLWLRTFATGMPPAQILDSVRFGAVMEVVLAGYQDLIALRDRLSKTTKIFLHQYDFAPPNGKGVCGVGPWLKPSLDFRSVPPDVQPAVTRLMLEGFAKVVNPLASPGGGVFVVPTQGTFPAQTSEWWANELHPTDKGFKAIAEKFHTVLKSQFPQLR